MKHDSGSELAAEIRTVFSRQGLRLHPRQVEQFAAYHRLLLEWNQRAGLVSRRDEGRVIERHFLESALLGEVSSMGGDQKILDLGSGGGFPGVPLRIMQPTLELVLLDSKRWKALFLKALVRELSFQGVAVVQGRAEDKANEEVFAGRFNVVVSRAVTELDRLYDLAMPFLAEGGLLLAVKGSRAEDECRTLTARHDVKVAIQPLYASGSAGPLVVAVTRT